MPIAYADAPSAYGPPSMRPHVTDPLIQRSTRAWRPSCCHVFQKSACIVEGGPLDRVYAVPSLTGYTTFNRTAGTGTPMQSRPLSNVMCDIWSGLSRCTPSQQFGK